MKDLNRTSGNNRFRFLSASEKLQELDIDVIHRLGRLESEPAADSTYFYESLKTWRDLNCTKDFKDFYKEIHKIVTSLPMLIHHKDRIVQILCKYLVPNSLALDALFSLATMLAKDLRMELSCAVPELLKSICSLLLIDPQKADPDTLEGAFTCILYLFKFLSKYLITDMAMIVDLFLPLMDATGKSHQKSNYYQVVRRFSGECVAYLLRKIKNPESMEQVMAMILSKHNDSGDYTESFAHLFFESIKGVKNQFHSRANDILPCLLLPHMLSLDFSTIKNTMMLIMEHSDNESSSVIGNILVSALRANPREDMFCLLAIFLSWKRGAKVSCIQEICALLNEHCNTENAKFCSPLVLCLIAYQESERSNILAWLKPSLEFIFSDYNVSSKVIHLLSKLHTAHDIKDQIVPLFYQSINSENLVSNYDRIIADSWMLVDAGILEISSSLSFPRAASFIAGKLIDNFQSCCSKSVKLLAYFDLEKKSLKAIESFLLGKANWTPQNGDFLACLLECYMELKTGVEYDGDISVLIISFLEENCIVAVEFLESAHRFLSKCRVPFESSSVAIKQGLVKRLVSASSKDRLVCLQLLQILFFHGRNNILGLAIKAESIQTSLKTYKEQRRHLADIERNVLKGGLEDDIVMIVASHLLGMLSINFTPLWKVIYRVFGSLASVSYDMTWDIIKIQIEGCFAKDQDNDIVMLEGDGKPVDFEDELTFIGDFVIPEFHVQNFFDLVNEGTSVPASSIDSKADWDCNDKLIRLLSLLKDRPEIAERQAKFLVPMFLSCVDDLEINAASDENEVEDNDTAEVADQDTAEVADQDTDEVADQDDQITIKSNRRKFLYMFLEIFCGFSNPKAVYCSEKLFKIYLDLLLQGETRLSSLALACILSYRDRLLNPRKDLFETLLDDHKFRDALASLVMDQESGSFSEEERIPVFQIIIRILYGKMIHRNGRNGARQNLGSKRRAVLTFIAGLREIEIDFFISLIVISKDCVMRQKIGFINILGDVFKYLNMRMVKHVAMIGGHVLDIAKISYGESDVNESSLLQNQRKLLRQGCLRRFSDLLEHQLIDLDQHMAILKQLNEIMIVPRLARFMSENRDNVSAILDLFSVTARSPVYLPLLFSEFKDVTGVPAMVHITQLLHVESNVCTAVIAKSLDIFESLIINSNNELDLFKRVHDYLAVHFNVILDTLDNFIRESIKSIDSKGTSWMRRAIAILSFLSPLAERNPETAGKMIDLFIPFLKRYHSSIDPATTLNTLQIISDFLSLNMIDSDGKYYNIVMSFFSSFQNRGIRDQLVKILGIYAGSDGALTEASRLCQDLNSFSERHVDEPDFEKRLAAFIAINKIDFENMSLRQCLPIIHNLLFFVQDVNEMSIRNHASVSLRKFNESVHQLKEKNSDYPLFSLVMHGIYPAIKKGMSVGEDIIRHEFLILLSQMVTLFPESFPDLVPLLADGDSEADVLLNLHHLQSHRRHRALRRLAEFIEEGKFQASTLVNLITPIITNFIFESDRLADHTLINESINVLCPLGRHLAWGSYHVLLRRIFKALEKKPELEKVNVRALVSLLNGFSFKIMDDEDESSIRIRGMVLGKILPKLYDLLIVKKSDEEVTFRIPVALAITQLLMKLDQKSLENAIPKLFMDLCNLLKSRLQDVRDSVRETLVKIMLSLGSRYFGFLVSQMFDLLTRGYQKHILGFTLHYLIKSLVHTWKVGDIDYCLEQIMEILVEDLFGSTAEEKTLEEYTGKIKEERAKKGFDALEMIGQVAGFSSLMKDVLFPFKAVLEETKALKIVKDVELALGKISIGLNRQESIESGPLLTLIHCLISGNLPLLENPKELVLSKGKKSGSKQKRESSTFETNFKVHVKAKDLTESLIDRKSEMLQANLHLFIQFGLMLLHSGCKGKRFDATETVLEAVVLACARVSTESKHPRVTALSLQNMSHLVLIPGLTVIETLLPRFMIDVFKIIQKVRNTASVVTQRAFKIVTLVLKESRFSGIYTMSNQQLCLLLELIKPDLEEPERQNTTFSLIKAIVAKKLVVPELYDLMKIIGELMVTSQSANVRLMCRQALGQFMLEYPLGKKRIESQMNFLIHNLSYVFESGRESVMEFWGFALEKFPIQVMIDYLQVLLIALAMRLVNDESSQCREMAGRLLQKLFIACPSDQRSKLLVSLFDGWLEEEGQKPQMKRLAFQLYGLYFEAFANEKKSLQDLVLSFLSEKGRRHFQANENSDWEYAYFMVSCIRKALEAVTDEEDMSMHSKCLAAIEWNRFESLLAHPHQWVRKVLTNLYLSVLQYQPDHLLVDEDEKVVDRLENLSRLAKIWCQMLRSPSLSLDLADSIIRCLYYISKIFYETLNQSEEDNVDEGDEDEDEDGAVEDAAIEDAVVEDDSEKKALDTGFSKKLRWLLRTISYQARMDEGSDHLIQKKYVLRYYLSLMKFMQPQDYAKYISHMLSLLYRMSENMNKRDQKTTSGLEDEVNSLGQTVLEKIRMFVGSEIFFQRFQEARNKVQKIRSERKQKRSLQAVVDPEASAARKIKRNEMKKASRKRKVADYASQKLKFGSKRSKK